MPNGHGVITFKQKILWLECRVHDQEAVPCKSKTMTGLR